MVFKFVYYKFGPIHTKMKIFTAPCLDHTFAYAGEMILRDPEFKDFMVKFSPNAFFENGDQNV